MKQDPQRSENGLVAMGAIHRPHGVQKAENEKSPSMTGFLFMILVRWRQGLALRRCDVVATF
ncbi:MULTISPECIES: hypothetical protein [Pseudomonas syringae group]|uniref:hypothetical protein n=1 Tax=Pseudomonas syringae group TaxID=136849 RepID=UPI0012D778FB|nr:hypothetical protein [Pseudomonas syringae group genomosp. 3]